MVAIFSVSLTVLVLMMFSFTCQPPLWSVDLKFLRLYPHRPVILTSKRQALGREANSTNFRPKKCVCLQSHAEQNRVGRSDLSFFHFSIQ
jgi:hypothetical protein